MKRNLYIGSTLAALLLALGIGQGLLEKKAGAQAGNKVMVPRFEVDPTYPKPLPNHWYQGMSIGVGIDANDHAWIVHRPTRSTRSKRPRARRPASAARRRRRFWSSTRTAPCSALGRRGHRRLQMAGVEPRHHHRSQGQRLDRRQRRRRRHGPEVHAGRQVPDAGRQEGRADRQQQPGALRMVAKISIDKKENEAYISDGYGNKRVVVIDADSGKFKRYWGAYGNKPDDTNLGRYNPDAPPAQQFRTPVHCAEMSNDRLVYVCDRVNDRIQVFTPEGKFVKEAWVSKRTLGDGSTWDIAFSNDPQQKFIYLADGKDEKVWILDGSRSRS
jgi:hypothetical protein